MSDEITAPELDERLQRDRSLLLVDVREPREWDLCHLEGAILVPLATIEEALAEMPRDRPVVLYCHTGIRSMTALQLLRDRGFTQVQSLAGGIDAWARLVAPEMPRY